MLRRIFITTSQVIFLGVAVWALVYKHGDQAGWLGLLGFVLLFVPDLLRWLEVLVLPFEYEILWTFFLFAALIVGESFDIYERYDWWDKMLHLLSGILVGYAAMLVLYVDDAKKKAKSGPWFATVVTMTFVLASAAIWELFEFSVDNLLHARMQHGLHDTLLDISFAGVGGIIMARISYYYFKNHFLDKHLPKHFRRFLQHNPELTKVSSSMYSGRCENI